MRQILGVFAALCATAMVAPVHAQDQASAAARESADRFALMQWGLALAGSPESDDGLIRMRNDLCLVVAAEDPALAAKVGRRVIANAKDVGIRARRGKCQTNAVIVFTDDAQAQLRALNADRGRVYGSLYASQLDRALATEDAGFAFQLAELDGVSAQGTKSRAGPMRTQPGGTNMIGSLVVIDTAAAAGMDAVQLADYATLRLLAPTAQPGTLTRQSATGQAPTILTLFDAPATAPAQMTRFDRAYLDSLYRLPTGAFARSVMARASRVALLED